jgi:hypothetical protein
LSTDNTCEAKLTFGLASNSTSGKPLSIAVAKINSTANTGIIAIIHSSLALPLKLFPAFFAIVLVTSKITV